MRKILHLLDIRWALLLAAAVAGAIGYFWWQRQEQPPRYITAPVSKGSIVRTAVTTGSVNPVVSVQVGSYVSGVIQALHCDYNTEVKAGQLCAKIDPRPFQVVVDQAAANLASAGAQLNKDKAALAYAKDNYERDAKLLKKGIVSQDAVDSDRSAYDQGKAQVAVDESTILQRKAALEAAQVNLDYTDIISPVDGTVVMRNVDVGQTVAASFQTPTLFLIAQDLTKMQVDTNVSESDIGGVKVGQKAFFTVEAYPGKKLWGRVAQLRQAPITVQNVVTYDVVVSVDNPDLELLPGMTANTRIIVADRENVLRIPLQALHFSPAGADRADTAASETGTDVPSHVWVLRQGKPVAVSVDIGLDDGTLAEVVRGDLKAGDQVVVNKVTSAGDNGRAAPPKRAPLRF